LLACLRISPHSLEELSHGLMLPVRRIAPIVKDLVAAGAIPQLESELSISCLGTLAIKIQTVHRKFTKSGHRQQFSVRKLSGLV